MNLTGRAVTAEHTRIHFLTGGLDTVDLIVGRYVRQGGTIFVLTDTHTYRDCFPVLASTSQYLADAVQLSIEPGESSKSLSVAEKLFMSMTGSGAGRDALLINLGGGMISDLGGFLAAGFKRGIPYINIPTSLIAMVDASVGGKTGVNLDDIKNQVGFFYSPAAVILSPGFLQTLPDREMLSGIAEMTKTALVGDASLWNNFRKKKLDGMMATPLTDSKWKEWIFFTVRIKNRIVRQDYREVKGRKALNFGHTVGHAIEAWSFRTGNPLSHGEAVAAGMVSESFLSVRKAGLDPAVEQEIRSFLSPLIPSLPGDRETRGEWLKLMAFDKKTRAGSLFFSLIRAPGIPALNVQCTLAEVEEALQV